MMNLRKLLYTCLCILAVMSCKKNEDTTTYPSLSGYLMIQGLPEFIEPGQEVELKVKGAEHPEGGAIGYSWRVSPSKATDTTDVFKHKFSDTLQTYTVTCYAFADGYTGLSATAYATAVASGYDGSIQGVEYKDIAEDSVSIRDMQYYYKTFGDQVWTLNNMAVSSGMPFRNAEVMSEVFGRYYNFEEAKAACDSLSRADGKDWVLPTKEDWETLEAYIKNNLSETYGKSVLAAMSADITFNDSPMWEYWPNIGDIRNGSGFSLIPVGYSNTAAKTSDGAYDYAAFWTSTEVTDESQTEETSTEAYYKYIICDQPDMQTGIGKKDSFGASVRCIRKN